MYSVAETTLYILTLAHSGSLNIPIPELQDVQEHTENAEIADEGYVPGVLTISHAEYAYNTAYSDLGNRISAENFEQIVKQTVMSSMLNKMDKICIDAVAALSYEDSVSAFKLTGSTKPTYENCVDLAAMLPSKALAGATWRMNPSVYFKWVLAMKDTNGKPIMDPTKKITDQALAGFSIVPDANLPADIMYFGNANKVHLNFARQPELNAWTDFDRNKEKCGVRSVAGAAAEPGSFVKMYVGA